MKIKFFVIAASIVAFVFFGKTELFKYLINSQILVDIPIIEIDFSSLLVITIFGVFIFILCTYAKFEEHKINYGQLNKFNKYVNFFGYLSNWSILFFFYLILLLLGKETPNTNDYYLRFLSCIFYLNCINYIFLVLLIVYIWVFAPFKDDLRVKKLINASRYFERIEKFIEQ
jgi:hypothetical protein